MSFSNVADPSAGAPSQDPYTRVYDYDGSGNMIYEGWAKAGVQPTDSYWAIRRYVYSGSQLTRSDWADGNSAQDNRWDTRNTTQQYA